MLALRVWQYILNYLYHAMENTANQNSRKNFPSPAARMIGWDVATVFSNAYYKIVMQLYLSSNTTRKRSITSILGYLGYLELSALSNSNQFPLHLVFQSFTVSYLKKSDISNY